MKESLFTIESSSTEELALRVLLVFFFSQEANVTLIGFKLTSDTQSTDAVTTALHMYLNMIN